MGMLTRECEEIHEVYMYTPYTVPGFVELLPFLLNAEEPEAGVARGERRAFQGSSLGGRRALAPFQRSCRDQSGAGGAEFVGYYVAV